jgi:DNA-binding transcriptional LysR family regulator
MESCETGSGLMELRHLRYFVMAAEEEHFGRAARRLNVSEPTLSEQLRDLERDVGVRLFERLTRGVRLTAAGMAFLEDTRRILEGARAAAERARRVDRGETGLLRIGRIPDPPPRSSEIIARLLATFRVRHPEVDMQAMHGSSAEQAAALREGRIDVAIVYSTPEDPAGFRSDLLAELALEGALLPAAHPLVSKRILRCRDLRALPLVLYPRSAHPLVYDAILDGLRERGLEPRLANERLVSDLTVCFGMVATGAGWTPITAVSGESLARTPALAYRGWADPAIPFAINLLWREDGYSDLVARFLAVAHELRAPGARAEPAGAAAAQA